MADKELKIGINIDADTSGATEAQGAMQRVEVATTGASEAAEAETTASRKSAAAMKEAGDAATSAASAERALASASDDLGEKADNASQKIEKKRKKVEEAGDASDKSAPKTRNMGNALLNLSRAADDAQYGISGIVNNIEGIAMALGAGTGVVGIATVAAVALNQLFKYFAEDTTTAKAKADELAEKMKTKADELKVALDKVAKDSAATQKVEWNDLVTASHESYTAAEKNAKLLTDEIERTLAKLKEQRDMLAEVKKAQDDLTLKAMDAAGAPEQDQIAKRAEIEKARLLEDANNKLAERSAEADRIAAQVLTLQAQIRDAENRKQSAVNSRATAEEAGARLAETAAKIKQQQVDLETLKLAKEKADADMSAGSMAKKALTSSPQEFADMVEVGRAKSEVLKKAIEMADAEVENLSKALSDAQARADQFPVVEARKEDNAATKALLALGDKLDATVKDYATAEEKLDTQAKGINEVLQRKTATVDVEAATASFEEAIEEPMAVVNKAVGSQNAAVKDAFAQMQKLMEGGITAAESKEFQEKVRLVRESIDMNNKENVRAMDALVKSGEAQGRLMQGFMNRVDSLQRQTEAMQQQINYLNSK